MQLQSASDDSLQVDNGQRSEVDGGKELKEVVRTSNQEAEDMKS